MGKTALAVHWAHQVAGRFPDGQLYVNLRGYDPDQPVAATDALAGFLRSLGVPGQDIPPGQEERAARYRSLLAGKRMLVVLDNAGSSDQVRPLLPGSSGCVVIVTSRDALAGLVARDGAARLDLDLLPRHEAVSLLRALLGDRVDVEPQAAATLAEQCTRLPLALRVAAELAHVRLAIPLTDLVAELADQRRRLELLDAGGDPVTAVSAVFSWSYRHLTPSAARTFRLLGLHPGPDLDRYAAAALTAVTADQAGQMLDVLARAHLTQPAGPAGPGRHGLHDLLHGYARYLAIKHDTENERRSALTRLFDYYLHTAAAAMDILFPAERHRRPRIPQPITPSPPLADPATAREWLDRQRAALVAAAIHGWPGHAIQLAATLARYLHPSGHYPEAITIYSHALRAARRTGDLAAEATTLNDIGEAELLACSGHQAADHFGQALTLFRAAGDRVGQARALGNLGLAEAQAGRYVQASLHPQQAVAIYRDLDDRSGEARSLGILGQVQAMQGRSQEAAGYFQRSLDISREIGDRDGEATALFRLGAVNLRAGRYQHAAALHQQALCLVHHMRGVTGHALIHLFRLLEAPAFKAAMAAAQTHLGVIVSDQIYTDATRRSGPIDPAAYTQVHLTCKETCTDAWLWLAAKSG